MGTESSTTMQASCRQPICDSITEPTVQAVTDGKRNALREIYAATSVRMFRLMVHLAGIQDADALTQHVYVQAYSKLSQFSSDSKFEISFYRLATAEALQYLRREKHRPTRELVVEPSTRQNGLAEQDEGVHLVRQALEVLDPELRAIFTLKEEIGLSYQEIAQTLGIPEGTVGSRLTQTRRELRKHLENAL